MMNLLLLLILAAICLCNVSAAGRGSCQMMDQSFESKMNNTCASVINYAFYVPEGMTAADLAEMAHNQLKNTTLKTVPTSCQQAVRDLLCANIYLKCYTSNVDNVGTYNYQIYSSIGGIKGVPMVRPCWNVCNAIIDKCMGLWHVTHQYPNCSATYDFSGTGFTVNGQMPTLYDNSSQCSTPAVVPIAESREEYQYKRTGGVCAGITDYVFVPPGASVKPYYSVFNEPYAVQSIIEETLQDRITKIPGWVNGECKMALLKYFCSSVFLYPQVITMESVLLAAGILAAAKPTVESRYPTMWDSSVTLPSFPNLNICTDYGDKCASFIKFANNSGLRPDCNGTSPLLPGVHRFTAKPQLISRTYAKALNKYVSFYTEPYNVSYYNTSELAVYEASCPYGYVYPDHPNNSHTQYIGVTGCAIACRPRAWTDDEWDFLINKALTIPVAGAVLSAILIGTFIYLAKDLRDNYLMMLYAVLSFAVAIASVALNRRPFDEAYCYDNSINTSQKLVSSSPCVIQGVIIVYTFLSLCGICFMMSLDVLLKLKEWNKVYKSPFYIAFQLIFVLGLPIIPVAYAGSGEMFGFSRTQPFCFIMQSPYAPKWIDLGLVAIPVAIVTGINAVVYITNLSLMFCCKSNKYSKVVVDNGNSVETSDAKSETFAIANDKQQALNRYTTMVFVGVMFCVWIGYCVLRGLYRKQHGEQFENFQDWTKCIFKNYNGDNEAANEICGEAFAERPKVGGTSWQIFCLTGTSIVVALVYLISFVWGWYTIDNTLKAKEIVVVASTAKNDEKEKEIPLNYKEAVNDDLVAPNPQGQIELV